MFIPPQGFRHAATLLLTNRARAISANTSAAAICTAIEHLARDLVALADDTRTAAGAADWLIAQLNMTIDRLPQSFEREEVKSAGAAILARVGSRMPGVVPCDLFLIYAPEDRLPVAAPLAVELTKRRVSVAFAEYEVATAQQLTKALAHGLAHHLGGAVLLTPAFQRAQQETPPSASDRLRIYRDPCGPGTVSHLMAWVAELKSR